MADQVSKELSYFYTQLLDISQGVADILQTECTPESPELRTAKDHANAAAYALYRVRKGRQRRLEE